MKLLDNRTGNTIEPHTDFSVEKDDNFLFFHFSAYDSSLNSYSNKNNDELYLGDVVEVFLDFGDEYYYEFEVAPNGATFLATIINVKPTFIVNDFFTSSVRIEGNNYFVEMRINLSKFKNKNNIRYNAFRIETKKIKTNLILQALSPTLSDTFHVRDKFLYL